MPRAIETAFRRRVLQLQSIMENSYGDSLAHDRRIYSGEVDGHEVENRKVTFQLEEITFLTT